MLDALATGLHAVAAVLWVGGMFFAYQILRPVVGELNPPPERLKFWAGIFARFFPWVWGAVAVLPVTGYTLIWHLYKGFHSSPIHIHWMHGIGWVMIALFAYLYFAPYRTFRATVEAADWPTGAAQLNIIRKIVATNLGLGLLTVLIGASGRFWAWLPGS
ncbi:MAG: CopD family protein [Rhodospirillaceae bacterium]